MNLRMRLTSVLPQSLVGAVEYHLHPARLDAWGGPFNGQCFRQLIFSDLVRACAFTAVVETGTYRGTTTVFLARNSSVPVYSSEANPRFFQSAKRRLKAFPNVHLYDLDSRIFLAQVPLPDIARPFFYLDAHWEDDLPLAEEVQFILQHFQSFVIMIDDFEVPGDSDYRFDDYGTGKRLSLRDFPFHQDARLCVYVPSRAGNQESGSRRGCVILSSADLKTKLDELPCLITLNSQQSRSAGMV